MDNRQVKSKSKVVDPLLVPLTKEQMKQKLNKLNKKEEKERNSMIELKANFKASRSRSLENNAKELTKEALELDQKQSGIYIYLIKQNKIIIFMNLNLYRYY